MRLDSLVNLGRPARLHLDRGFSWFNVKKNSRNFAVTTPTAIAGVRGTKFAVSESSRGALACVCEGSIDTRAAGASRASIAEKGASLTYDATGDFEEKDLTKYFRGLKADRSFQSQILKDGRLNYCKTCHTMTNLATDQSPDPARY